MPVTKHESVGGTGLVLTDDDGRVIFAGTLDSGEPVGLMIVCLEQYQATRQELKHPDRPEG